MDRRHALKNVALFLGGTLSAPTLLAMNRWQSADFNFLAAADFSLTETHRKIVAAVAEMILPKSNTPGALDAGCPAFIELMLKDCYKKPEQTSFVEGLNNLEQSGFLNLDGAQRKEALTKLQADAKTAKGTTYWRLMKELTLLGYYTSEVGIKASFDYQPIPGKLELIKIKPEQKIIVY